MTMDYRSRRSREELLEELAKRRQRVATMTRRGMTSRQIAEALGVSQRAVIRDRQATGTSLAPASTPMTAEEISLAERLLADGCSHSEVGRTLGHSQSTISRRFPGRGWTREQQAEHLAAIRRYRGLLSNHPPRKELVS